MPPSRRRSIKYRRRPYRRFKVNRRKRIINKKRASYKRGLRQSLRGFRGQPFPKRLFTTFTYTEETSLNALDATGASVLNYRLNSLFDPKFAVGGIQPRYFDTLCNADNTCAPYRNYIVYAAKLTATFNAYTVDSKEFGYVGLHVRNSTSDGPVSKTWDNISQIPDTKMKAISAQNNGSSKNTRTISVFRRMKGYVANKDLRDNENMAAQYDASPATTVMGDIFAIPTGTLSNLRLTVLVKIKFYAMLYNKTVPQES